MQVLRTVHRENPISDSSLTTPGSSGSKRYTWVVEAATRVRKRLWGLTGRRPVRGVSKASTSDGKCGHAPLRFPWHMTTIISLSAIPCLGWRIARHRWMIVASHRSSISHGYSSQTLLSFCGHLRPCLPRPCSLIFNPGEVAALPWCNCGGELLDRVLKLHVLCAARSKQLLTSSEDSGSR